MKNNTKRSEPLLHNAMKNTETQSQASLPRIVWHWQDLAELPESETHRLKIDVANSNGWIVEKRTTKGYDIYLSTHTFSGEKHEYSTRILRECGWNVTCANWDMPNDQALRPAE